jgi:transcriptional regulator with XRE-family HTH domain
MITTLRKYRLAHGLVLSELAALIEVSPQHISLFEQNKKLLPINKARQIASWLSISIEDLLLLDSDGKIIGNRIDESEL